MKRSFRGSKVLVLMLLSPLLLAPVECETGDPTLADLELEVLGQNQIVGFTGTNTNYAVSVPASMAIVRAQAVVGAAAINYTFFGTTVETGLLGVGSGETMIEVPEGMSSVVLSVSDSGAARTYSVSIDGVAGACGDGTAFLPEECDDGNTTGGDGCAADCTLEPITKTIPMACSNNATNDVYERAYELTVDLSGPVAPSAPIHADLSGQALIADFWLDAVQTVIAGGVTEVGIKRVNASVAVRSGASGADVLLTRTQPFAAGECNLTASSCSSDLDCIETCFELLPIPILDGLGDNCAACDAAGKSFSCSANGFCSGGDLVIPLEPAASTFRADAFGSVLIGWNEDLLPPVLTLYNNPPGPNGVRWEVAAGGLVIAAECYMGTADAGLTTGIPLVDADLIEFPIIHPPSTCGDGVAGLPEECDDGNTTGGDGCAADCTLEPITKTIPMACSNGVNSDVYERAYELTVDLSGPVAPFTPIQADLSGKALIADFWLDAVQTVIAGGVTEVGIKRVNASVAVRSGASGADVLLTRTQPFAAGECNLTASSCSTDLDCIETCFELLPIPILDGLGDNCAACDAAGKSFSCAANGFCSGGDLVIPLEPAASTFTADASGSVLIGWNEDLLPPVLTQYNNPPGPNGVRWEVAVGNLVIAAECYMGTANLAQTAGVALLDQDLIQLPIINVGTVCGNGVVEVTEECDDNNTMDGDACASDCTIEPITKSISVACRDSVVEEVRDIEYELTFDPLDPILAGSSFDADFTAVAAIPEFFLDALQGVFPGGMTVVDVVEVNAAVSVRSGATGPDVPLSFSAGPVTIPTNSNCAACTALGANKGVDCANNGFCVDGDALVQLGTELGTFTAGASGEVLFGWSEGSLPAMVSFASSAGPNGSRWTAGGLLSVGYECFMGTANVGMTGLVPLPDTDLISTPIL